MTAPSPVIAHIIRLEPLHSLPGRVRFRYRTNTAVAEAALTAAVQKLDGVQSVRLNAAARSLLVSFDAKRNHADALRHQLLAMDIAPLQTDAAEPPLLPLIPAANLLATAAARYALPEAAQTPMSLAIAAPVMWGGVQDLFRHGITSHVLEALAVGISIYRRDHTAANLTSFLLELGDYMEQSIVRRSDALLKSLLKPAHNDVWVLRDNKEICVGTEDVLRGDCVLAAAGQVIAVDGTVIGGAGLVNEATMTGESAPVAKTRGSKVLSGTVVTEGHVQIYAENVGSEVSAQRIADYVSRSLQQKSQTQLGANRLADRLIPLVLGTALLSRVVSGQWQHAAAILQVDYSCALKLTTPVAFKAAMFQGGKRQVLVKSATGLEKLAQADTVVFDKTGTLTRGVLKVTDALTFSSQFSHDDILNLAASVEEHYTHPMAMAVVEAARSLPEHHHFDHREVEFVVAHGVASEIGGKRIVVGSRHFIAEDEAIPLAPNQDAIDRLEADGKTVLYIGFGGELVGVIAMHDQLRDNAAATIARLRQAGIKRAIMLSGDRRNRAAAIAETLQLDEFHAELLPEDKARIMADLAAQGAKIAFVGDGINDAPALSSAHVGIAMAQGADIARLAADIALLDDDIALVAEAKTLADNALKLVGQNFHAAVGLNSLILAAATGGKIAPMTASALHNSATIAILLHALLGLNTRNLCPPVQAAGKSVL